MVFGAIPIPGLFDIIADKEPVAHENVRMLLYDTTKDPTGTDSSYAGSLGSVPAPDRTTKFSVDPSGYATTYVDLSFAARDYRIQCDPRSGFVGTSHTSVLFALMSFVLGLLVLAATLMILIRNRLRRGLDIARLSHKMTLKQNHVLDAALSAKQAAIELLTATQHELEAAK